MTDEHRLTFELTRATELEAAAMNSIIEKTAISKRSHEYVRRVMVQGLILRKILKKTDKDISELITALSADISSYKLNEFKLRLNVDTYLSTKVKTPETEIWESISKISKRKKRKKFLRELFIYGFWLETLPDRDLAVISQLVSRKEDVNDNNIIGLSIPSTVDSTKSKLGGLMPL